MFPNNNHESALEHNPNITGMSLRHLEVGGPFKESAQWPALLCFVKNAWHRVEARGFSGQILNRQGYATSPGRTAATSCLMLVFHLLLPATQNEKLFPIVRPIPF